MLIKMMEQLFQLIHNLNVRLKENEKNKIYHYQNHDHLEI